ncbi:hypothetical protein ACLKA6_007499 [Drosophila palustris]
MHQVECRLQTRAYELFWDLWQVSARANSGGWAVWAVDRGGLAACNGGAPSVLKAVLGTATPSPKVDAARCPLLGGCFKSC